MARYLGRNWSRTELERYIGDISQIGGVRRFTLTEGNQAGVEMVELRTGGGLRLVIVPGRGMDISAAEYKDVSLCWRSSTGEVAGSFFEPEGYAWSRSFFGGLLTTCGLTYAGHPCVDKDENLGLHGRVSQIPAKNVWSDGEWQGDEYNMWVQGKVRETTASGKGLEMTRKISSVLGQNCFTIHDRIENKGWERCEHMILYHFNLGFPLLDENTRIHIPSKKTVQWKSDRPVTPQDYSQMHPPKAKMTESVFFHDCESDREGRVSVTVENPNLLGGLKLSISYYKTQLPRLLQWKMLGEGIYVVGIEPANCLAEGRAWERAQGTLQFLEPGEVREYRLQVSLEGRDK